MNALRILWHRWLAFNAQVRYEKILTLEAEYRLDLARIEQARTEARNALKAAKRRVRAEELVTARLTW